MELPTKIRKAKGGAQHSAYAEIGFWAEKHGSSIQIHISGPTRTWVTNNPDSIRFHRTLFRDLRDVLVQQGCWQFGEEGSDDSTVVRGAHLRPVPLPDGVSISQLIREERDA